MDVEEKFSVKYEILVEYNGAILADSKLVSLLRLIGEKGSILMASKTLGIPYSRAWDMIARAERVLGKPLIMTARGGRRGGARLTDVAKEIIAVYDEAERKLSKVLGPVHRRKFFTAEKPGLTISYSHDPLIELLVGKLARSKKYSVEGSCMGSGLSLASLALRESDIACIHLYDPEKRTYNEPYIEKYWLKNDSIKLGGYYRELVFAVRNDLDINSLDKILLKIVSGELRIVNRNKGSGTRVYLDYLIDSTVKKYGISKPFIKGYGNEVYTHIDAARQVALGKADVALVLMYAAKMYRLKTIHVTWEIYECYTVKERYSRQPVKDFETELNSSWFRELLDKTPGYRLLNE